MCRFLEPCRGSGRISRPASHQTVYAAFEPVSLRDLEVTATLHHAPGSVSKRSSSADFSIQVGVRWGGGKGGLFVPYFVDKSASERCSTGRRMQARFFFFTPDSCAVPSIEEV